MRVVSLTLGELFSCGALTQKCNTLRSPFEDVRLTQGGLASPWGALALDCKDFSIVNTHHIKCQRQAKHTLGNKIYGSTDTPNKQPQNNGELPKRCPTGYSETRSGSSVGNNAYQHRRFVNHAAILLKKGDLLLQNLILFVCLQGLVYILWHDLTKRSTFRFYERKQIAHPSSRHNTS